MRRRDSIRRCHSVSRSIWTACSPTWTPPLRRRLRSYSHGQPRRGGPCRSGSSDACGDASRRSKTSGRPCARLNPASSSDWQPSRSAREWEVIFLDQAPGNRGPDGPDPVTALAGGAWIRASERLRGARLARPHCGCARTRCGGGRPRGELLRRDCRFSCEGVACVGRLSARRRRTACGRRGLRHARRVSRHAGRSLRRIGIRRRRKRDYSWPPGSVSKSRCREHWSSPRKTLRSPNNVAVTRDSRKRSKIARTRPCHKLVATVAPLQCCIRRPARLRERAGRNTSGGTSSDFGQWSNCRN